MSDNSITPGSSTTSSPWPARLRLALKWLFIVMIWFKVWGDFKLIRFHYRLLLRDGYDGSNIFTDYLINYQGGFVRRGLLGELLWQLQVHQGLDPRWVIIPLTLFCLVAVVAWFVWLCWRRGLAMYILPLTICLGLCIVTRRDYLMLLLVCLMLWGWQRFASPAKRLLMVVLPMLLLLNIHEGTIFFAWPILSLLIWSDKQMPTWQKCLGIGVPVAMFAVLSLFKGDKAVAEAVVQSWAPYFPEGWTGKQLNGIRALGWETLPTFKFHWTFNYLTPCKGGPIPVYGWMTRPLIYLMTFYLMVFYPWKFRRGGTREESRVMVRLVLFVFICLLPSFTIMSCDLGRIIFYWTMTALAAYLLIPNERLLSCFPQWYGRMADGLLAALEHVKPSHWLLALIMTVVTITPVQIEWNWPLDLSVAKNFYNRAVEIYGMIRQLM